MSEEEYEQEEGQEEHVCVPCWSFSLWDVVGIGFVSVANIAGAVGHAAGLLSTQCAAAANYSRQTREIREAQRFNEAARRKMAADLERLVSEGDA